MDKYKIERNIVQETLIIPLYGRRLCSQRYPQLFQDQSAAKLMERMDHDFSELERHSGDLMQVFGALEVVLGQSNLTWEVRDYLRAHPKAAIINLGCGLDGRHRCHSGGRHGAACRRSFSFPAAGICRAIRGLRARGKSHSPPSG